jgi:hypothetical protein
MEDHVITREAVFNFSPAFKLCEGDLESKAIVDGIGRSVVERFDVFAVAEEAHWSFSMAMRRSSVQEALLVPKLSLATKGIKSGSYG